MQTPLGHPRYIKGNQEGEEKHKPLILLLLFERGLGYTH